MTYSDEQGNELSPPEVLYGRIGGSYSTENRTIKGWKLIKVPENATGIFRETAQVVKYVYEKEISVFTPTINEVNSNSYFPKTGEHSNSLRIIGAFLTLIIILFYKWKRKFYSFK